MPTPPGTSDRARPEDLPEQNKLGSGVSNQTLLTVALVAVPVIFGVVLWASLSDRD